MAKRNKVFIDVMVNGKMEKVSVDAAKLGKQLDKVGTSAHTADRRLKGAAQASSGASKNFSKMGQGMGGLVAVYASFAAQVFALTALFNGLKRAADLENLRKSQISFASSSGLAIQSLTSNLREASQGMLGFQEAAQAAAIGVAKGFSGGQLEQLVVGATKASASLGRNFDDTFDRLLRGVSKAEPELLDELGITLRLEEATKRYAEAIGTTRDKLTTAQRSQAVFVETMRQLNDTFGAQEAQTNPFVQLAKTFEDISQTVVKKVMPPIESLVNLINKNAQAAATAFAALAILVASNLAGVSAGVGLVFGKIGGFAKGVVGLTASVTGTVGKKAGGFISKAAQNLSDEIEFAELLLEEAVENTTSKLSTGAEKALAGGATSKTLEKISKGEVISPQALGRLEKDLKRVQKEIEETGETSSKAFAGMTVDAIKEMRKELNHFKNNTVSYGTKAKKVFGKIVVGSIKAVRKTAEGATFAVRKLAAAGEFAAKHFGKLKKALRLGGMILTGILVVAKAVDQLAESPIRVIDGFKSMVSSTVKLLARLFNFIIAGLNKLLDNSLVNSIFEGGLQIGEMDASGIDAYLDRVEGRILNRLGTSRQELQVVQDINDARKAAIKVEEDRIQRVKDLREEYNTLFSDLDSILDGVKPQDIFKVATAASTADLAGAIQQYGRFRREVAEAEALGAQYFREGKFDEAYAAMNSSSIINEMADEVEGGLRRRLVAMGSIMPPLLQDALNEAFANPTKDNTDRVGFLQSFAASMVADENALRDMVGSLNQTIGTGDPIEQEIGMQRILDTIENIKFAIKTLYGEDTLINNNISFVEAVLGEDYQTIPTRLRAIGDELERIKDERAALQREEVRQGNYSNLVKQQKSRVRNAALENLLLQEKQQKLEQLSLKNIEDSDAARKKHALEVSQLKREIALQAQKAMQAERNIDIIEQASTKLTQGFEDGFVNAFDSIIQGTQSVKDAFLSMGQSILRILARLIAEMIAVKIMQTIIGMTPVSGATAAKAQSFGVEAVQTDLASKIQIGPPVQGRYGGVMSNGKKVAGYSAGGIARGPQAGYPAVLHGTEAVVPLPNNKSIPVDLRGAGQQNNVTVNVSVDSNGQSTQDSQADSNNAAKLGTMIASAVQKELHNQKRAGGILSPMGVS